jgi:hypothetical protein
MDQKYPQGWTRGRGGAYWRKNNDAMVMSEDLANWNEASGRLRPRGGPPFVAYYMDNERAGEPLTRDGLVCRFGTVAKAMKAFDEASPPPGLDSPEQMRNKAAWTTSAIQA